MNLNQTWVWILQLLLKSGKSRTQRLRILQEDFIHDQNSLLPDVRLSVGHLSESKQRRRLNKNRFMDSNSHIF